MATDHRHRPQLTRRQVLAGTWGAMLAYGLIGCGPATEPATTRATNESAAATSTSAPKAAAPASTDGPATIRYGRWANPAEIKAGQNIIDKFQASQPKVKVEPAFLPWGDYWPKIQAELAAGTAPDVIQMSVWYIVDFMENKALVDLNDNIKTAGINPDKYFTNTMVQWNVAGKQGCLPSGLFAGAFFYNKKLFDEAKVPYLEGDVTWQDLADIGTKLTVDANGKHPNEASFDSKNIVHWGVLASPGFGNGVIENWMAQNGGGILDKEQKCLLTKPESVQAVETMFDLVRKYKVSPTPEEVQGVGNPFLAGLVAMMQDNHSRITEANMTKDLVYDIVQPPIPTKGGRKYANSSSNGNAIYGKSKNQDAAWQFLEFTISKDMQTDMAKLKEVIPFNKEVANSPAYLTPPPDNMAAFLKDAELPSSTEVSAVTKHMGEWNAAAQKAYEAAWLGKISVADAATQACQDIAKILAS